MAGRTASKSSNIRMPRWHMRMRPGRRVFRLPSCAAMSEQIFRQSTLIFAPLPCPFTGEKLAAVPAINPDITFIHALKADRAGNVLIEGIVGVQKEAVLAA